MKNIVLVSDDLTIEEDEHSNEIIWIENPLQGKRVYLRYEDFNSLMIALLQCKEIKENSNNDI